MHVAAEYITPVLAGLASIQNYAQEWYLDKGLSWPAQPPVNKIDVHHHMVPDFYAKAVEDNGGDPSGWPTPKWSASSSRMIMKHLGVQTAILSVPAPGPCITPNATAQAALARRLNDHAAALRDEDHATFGFFAALPDPLAELPAALAELARALDHLGADGVVLLTRYGNASAAASLGHARLDPLWRELARREATVLVHPAAPAHPPPAGKYLPLPVVEQAHETARAALDMIAARTLRRFPGVRVVLSHAGGTLPFVMGRVAAPLRRMPGVVASWVAGTTHEEAVAAFRGFYYEVALSTAPEVLRMLLDVVPHDHIVYGSDFPFAPAPAYPAFLEDLESFDMSEELRNKLNFENAFSLIPRLGKQVAELK